MLRRTKQQKKAAKNSFWEPGNYKKTTKRILNGYKLCSTLQELFQERAKIEASYAKNLREWSKLCNSVLDKGPEYGTMRNALKGILAEAECLSDIHSRVKNHLRCGEFQELQIWQNCAYTPVFTKIEEHKQMEGQFEKAQKPYAKLLAKVNTTKQNYHKSCEEYRGLLVQVRYAASEVNLSPAQKKTLGAYIQRSKNEVASQREQYEKALQNLNEYHPIYVHDMNTLFTKCQEMEGARLTLFKSALFSVHRALKVIQDQSLSQIYEDFHKTVDAADCHTDLEWWAQNYGADMPFELPSFDEYPDFQVLSKNYEAVHKLLDTSHSLPQHITVQAAGSIQSLQTASHKSENLRLSDPSVQITHKLKDTDSVSNQHGSTIAQSHSSDPDVDHTSLR